MTALCRGSVSSTFVEIKKTRCKREVCEYQTFFRYQVSPLYILSLTSCVVLGVLGVFLLIVLPLCSNLVRICFVLISLAKCRNSAHAEMKYQLVYREELQKCFAISIIVHWYVMMKSTGAANTARATFLRHLASICIFGL